jgi:arylsulfatase A-like enzyme
MSTRKSIYNLILMLFLIPGCNKQDKALPPNIVYIMTDQQAFDAMSCAGNPLVQTPALDRLASDGIRFDQAYCAFPLCVPSRAAMFSGRMPHEAGIFVNTNVVRDEEFPFEILGRRLTDGGYKTHYIGKWHLTVPLSDTLKHGFKGIDIPGGHGFDSVYARMAAEFLRQEHDRPFFLVVSFRNPHDCCQLARKEDLSKFEGAIPPLPAPDKLPALPENFGIPENEPDHFREWQAENSESVFRSYFWDEQDFREYQWGYYRLVEKVDSLIGRVLDAISASPGAGNTAIIFASDHGDGISRHQWNQKWSPYDEASRVPFIMAGSMVHRKGETDGRLVSAGLDLVPTVCDLAGIDPPPAMRGRSLKPLLESGADLPWREYIVTEISLGNWVNSYHVDTFPKVRMLRTTDYKYVAFDRGQLREQLTDMINDPGEMKNLAMDPQYADVLNRHRKLLKEWVSETGDKFQVPE